VPNDPTRAILGLALAAHPLLHASATWPVVTTGDGAQNNGPGYSPVRKQKQHEAASLRRRPATALAPRADVFFSLKLLLGEIE